MPSSSTSSEPVPFLERLPLARGRPVLATALTLAIAGAALFLRQLADPYLPSGFPYVTFFPAVIVTSFLFGAQLGSVSAVLCGLFAWYFFIPPAHSFDLHVNAAIALAFYVFVVVTDILLVHWMQRANIGLAAERERNRALAETRRLLFSELQHRVSNNLQVTAALVSLQRRHVADEAARAALDEASRRIAVVGRISRQLYAVDGENHALRTLLEPICADVIDASGKRIELAVADSPLTLAGDAAVPVALIVAEAVANAIEHGFEGRESGRIEVQCVLDGDQTRIEVIDDGRGLPDGFDPGTRSSLGLRIATMLAAQLGGRFDLERGMPGTVARLTLAS